MSAKTFKATFKIAGTNDEQVIQGPAANEEEAKACATIALAITYGVNPVAVLRWLNLGVLTLAIEEMKQTEITGEQFFQN